MIQTLHLLRMMAKNTLVMNMLFIVVIFLRIVDGLARSQIQLAMMVDVLAA
jgi:hypothetical protein